MRVSSGVGAARPSYWPAAPPERVSRRRGEHGCAAARARWSGVHTSRGGCVW
jgi:hypothetical protein